MLIRKLARISRYMAEADDNDGGGGGSTTIDDADGAETVDLEEDTADRGDKVEPDLDAEALKRVAGDDGAADEADAGADAGKDGKPKGSQHVPIGRFNEVNEQKKALERENAELKAKVSAEPKPSPAPTEAPKPKFDETKAEREYATLLAEGEFDKAVALRQQINAHLREQARDEAETNIRAGMEQRETVLTLTSVAEQAVKDWPYLDTEEGAETMDLILATRDGLHAKGMPLPQALKTAVAKIAPKFAPEGAQGTPGKDSSAGKGGADTRAQQANARGADASTRQPPKLEGGAGNRATQGKVAVEDMDEEQFNSLSAAEKRRLRGDEG